MTAIEPNLVIPYLVRLNRRDEAVQVIRQVLRVFEGAVEIVADCGDILRGWRFRRPRPFYELPNVVGEEKKRWPLAGKRLGRPLKSLAPIALELLSVDAKMNFW